MSIQTIMLKNFSVFEDLSVHLGKQINVFIGENGTGKTQILKAIYTTCKISHGNTLSEALTCFGIVKNDTSFVRNAEKGAAECVVELENKMTEHKFEEYEQSYVYDKRLNKKSKSITYKFSKLPQSIPAVYIPVKDMLTHSKGLLAMSRKYQDFPFDATLLDIIDKASQWQLKETPALAKSILPILESMMQGKVVIKNEEFYIEKYDGRRVNFSLEAEGLKKIGLLWQLLMNESITEGCIVLWDEPEANVNPKFIPVLVDCMMELSRHGVQICLSTHSYILAKYIEIKMNKNDAVQFHSLYQTKKGVQCESCHTFQDLRHNSIMKGFEALMEDVYDKQIKQMGD